MAVKLVEEPVLLVEHATAVLGAVPGIHVDADWKPSGRSCAGGRGSRVRKSGLSWDGCDGKRAVVSGFVGARHLDKGADPKVVAAFDGHGHSGARTGQRINRQCRFHDRAGAELDAFAGLVSEITTGLANQLVAGVRQAGTELNAAIERAVNDTAVGPGVQGSVQHASDGARGSRDDRKRKRVTGWGGGNNPGSIGGIGTRGAHHVDGIARTQAMRVGGCAGHRGGGACKSTGARWDRRTAVKAARKNVGLGSVINRGVDDRRPSRVREADASTDGADDVPAVGCSSRGALDEDRSPNGWRAGRGDRHNPSSGTSNGGDGQRCGGVVIRGRLIG